MKYCLGRNINEGSVEPGQVAVVVGELNPAHTLLHIIANKEELLALKREINNALRDFPEPHPHYKLMQLYAQDAERTKEPWLLWERRKPGSILSSDWETYGSNPTWATDWEYRRKEGV